MIKELWQGLGPRERFGLIAGSVLIVAATVAAALWTLRTEYQVVFAELAPGDAALMVAELERMKIPYQLGEGGAAILVDRDIAHKTRIQLMGKNLPLHGAVGFELFNNTDFGMTEFAQKVNYQRALQGELTRTILALSEIQDARVHLVLPDEGLFRRAQGTAKASITLALKAGRRLSAEQVTGIQRLVSAAVQGIAMQDVTLIDQHGVALTRNGDANAGGDASSGRLDLKKETEAHLARKANEVLERAFGRAQALVSVDVLLNLDQIRTTTEDVIGAPALAGQAATGIVTRERAVTHEGIAPLDRIAAEASGKRGGNGSTQHEVEYSVGKRVEQVVTGPGSIRRLQVVAVLARGLDANQIEPVREMLAAAVGASKERGDTVVVYAFDAAAASRPATAEGAPLVGMADAAPMGANVAGTRGSGVRGAGAVSEDVAEVAVNASAAGGSSFKLADLKSAPIGLVAATLVVGLFLLLALLFARGRRRVDRAMTPQLTERERQAALSEVRLWLHAGPEPVESAGRGPSA